jgi:hypothetical protein
VTPLLTLLASSPFLLGGIQVNEDDHWYWTRTLDRIGMNTVATTVYAKQGDWDSHNLWHEDAPAVIAEIREAKQAGLSVVLVLRVALDHAFARNRFLWHGMIMPKSDEAIDEWFRRYADFTAKWARIAEREGVDVLAVGSEMNALASTTRIEALPELEAYYLSKEHQAEYEEIVARSSRRIEPRHIRALGGFEFSTPRDFVRGRARVWEAWATQASFAGEPGAIARINARAMRLDRGWREVIRRARAEYRGKLTYAANFDQYPRVGFWDELDLIGVNAYFQLRTGLGEADLAVLMEGWSKVLSRLERFRTEAGLGDRGVLFTELGYTYRRRSTLEPWSQAGFSVVPDGGGFEVVTWSDEPQDMTERALAIRALHRVQRSLHPDLLAGILYWKLSTNRDHLPMEPFVLIIDEDPIDPLQNELLRFAGDAVR